MKLIDTILGFVQVGVAIGLLLLMPWMWAMLIIAILYTITSIWYIWRNPESMVTLITIAEMNNDPDKDETWYVKVLNFIGWPIYWFVDKLKAKMEAEDEQG